jgi:perosamine synthetase
MKVAWSPPNLKAEDEDALIRVIKSGWLTDGKETGRFEQELADYTGAKHVIATNNGTSALIAALLAGGVSKDDEVIVPSFTFIASVNSILAIGAKPILVDCALDTFNITLDKVKEKITEKTKAIMFVDVSGMANDIDKFRDLAKGHNLVLIEDAAQAIGGEYKGRKIGSFGHTTIFSFHMAKLITTVEGGCVLTNNDEIAKKIRMLKNHGMQARYDYGFLGLNFKTTDIQSALGRTQLKRLDYFVEKRNKLAEKYKRGLKNCRFQEIPDYVTKHPYMLFGALVNPEIRDDLNKYLNDNGVDTRICWLPAHEQEYHNKIFPNEILPNSEKIASQIINLPMGNGLTEEEVDYVINTFNNYFK